jgi:alpha-glucoside transport system substrate-binding protein
MRIRSTVRFALTAGAVALLTAGCLSSGGGGGGGKNTSSSIELMYGFTGNQDKDFQKVVKAWAGKNNVTVKFSPTADFNNLINTRVQGNQLPDVAMFPQPGIMAAIAKQGKLADLGSVLDAADLKANSVPGALEAGQVDGKQYAVLVSANIKSIIYYPKKAAQAAGITSPPQTFDDLLALSAKIKAAGQTPWCFGIESAAATGWPATDWVENLMLVDYGSDVYNQWVQHKIPFNDPKVLAVTDQIQKLLLDNGETNGGRKAIASNNFGTAGNPMFDTPPKCYMYRQGNFLAQPGFFPKPVLADIDNTVGVFPLPGKTADSHPVEGGGDMAALFSQKNDSAKKLIKYLTSKEFGDSMAPLGWYMSPRTDVDVTKYPSKITQQFATINNAATEFVFDGSDQMPGAVGSGTFWKEMVTWISGGETAKQALDNIEASWPK